MRLTISLRSISLGKVPLGMLSLGMLSLLAVGCDQSPTVANAGSSGARAPSKPGTVLITGSNRGIGLEFARQYAASGWKVIATARNPASATDLEALAAKNDKVTIERLDVTDFVGIKALAEKYRGQPIDLLINNAGVRGKRDAQLLGSLDYETFQQVMAVNVYGPMAVSQAFFEHVATSEHKKIVVLTSQSGSLTLARRAGAGLYFYRISKAAANMAMITLHGDGRARGIKVGILSPGPAVNTRMLRMDGYEGDAMEPEDAVAALMQRIASLNAENSGTFLQSDGTSIPW